MQKNYYEGINKEISGINLNMTNEKVDNVECDNIDPDLDIMENYISKTEGNDDSGSVIIKDELKKNEKYKIDKSKKTEKIDKIDKTHKRNNSKSRQSIFGYFKNIFTKENSNDSNKTITENNVKD